MRILISLLLFVLAAQSASAISNVEHRIEEDVIRISFDGKPPFLVNIRGDSAIGERGGYYWTLTSDKKIVVDMGFAYNLSDVFYYGVKDNEWTGPMTFVLGDIPCGDCDAQFCERNAECPLGACVDGVCGPCSRSAECGDLDLCTKNICVDGVCTNPPEPNGESCGDDLVCQDGRCGYVCSDGTHVSSIRPEYVGMAINQGEIDDAAKLHTVMLLLEDAGVHYVRTGGWNSWWHSIEKPTGTYDWTYLDAQINEIRDAGIEPVLTIWGTRWDLSDKVLGSWWRSVPSDISKWEQWIRLLVRRYGAQGTNQVHNWEIWNEPDVDKFFKGSSEQYVEMINLAYQTIKEEDANAIVWGPATVKVSDSYAKTPEYNFTRMVMESGAFDVFSIHLYIESIESKQSAVRRVRAELDELGHANVPIAVTETNKVTPKVNGEQCYTASEQEQAEHLREIYYCLHDDVDHLFWWNAKDLTKDRCPDDLMRSGVLHKDFTPKESYYALKKIGT